MLGLVSDKRRLPFFKMFKAYANPLLVLLIFVKFSHNPGVFELHAASVVLYMNLLVFPKRENEDIALSP